jgi:hypothetical protein
LAKLVYIGGYGRSGSTLLEYLLTVNPEVVGCGEVARHLRSFGRRKICTCGRPMQTCPIWRDFQHTSERLEGLDHEQLTLALLEHVSGAHAVMVDSSKTAWDSTLMPFRLARRLGEDFLLVHLVRDPRAVCWSTMRAPWRIKRTRKRGRVKLRQKSRRGSSGAVRSLRTIIGWTIANLACEMFGWRHPDRYLRVRYEDLAQAPLKMVGQVLSRVSLEAPSTLERSDPADNRHQLYGNAMRFGSVSPTEIKEDVAWKTAMPKGYRWLVAGLCWPLCLRYGYGMQVAEAPPSIQ